MEIGIESFFTKIEIFIMIVRVFKYVSSQHATEAVWNEINDMLQASTPTEPRQSALRFLACLAAGQVC